MIEQRRISAISNRTNSDGTVGYLKLSSKGTIAGHGSCSAWRILHSENYLSSKAEPRDLYDIYYLTENQGIEVGFLIDDIDKKLQFKGSSLDERKGEFEKKERRLQQLWRTRLSAQMASLPEFEDVYRAVKRTFRQAGIHPEK